MSPFVRLVRWPHAKAIRSPSLSSRAAAVNLDTSAPKSLKVLLKLVYSVEKVTSVLDSEVQVHLAVNLGPAKSNQIRLDEGIL